MYAIANGNLEDGYYFIGPFDTPETAQKYAERHIYSNWHLIWIDTPPEVDDEYSG